MEIRVEQSVLGRRLDILFCEDRGEKFFAVEPLTLTLKEIPDCIDLKPTISLPIDSGIKFLESVDKALKHIGLKREKEISAETETRVKDEIINTLREENKFLKDQLNRIIRSDYGQTLVGVTPDAIELFEKIKTHL